MMSDLHDCGHADGSKVEWVDGLDLHSDGEGGAPLRRDFVLWKHVGGAVRRPEIVHRATVKVLLAGHDLVPHPAGPPNLKKKKKASFQYLKIRRVLPTSC